jgi:hypothetical protein
VEVSLLFLYFIVFIDQQHFIFKGIERDKVIIQYARKPGLAHNQRWTYQNGFIFPTSAPHLVLDIRVNIYI